MEWVKWWLRGTSIVAYPFQFFTKNSQLQLIVYDRSVPGGKLSSELAVDIRTQFESLLLNQMPESSSPAFESIAYEDGLLKVACKDEAGKQWIQSAVSYLSPSELGDHIKVVEANNFRIPMGISILVPGTKGERESAKKVLSLIASQNPDLAVHSWYLVGADERKGGAQIKLMVSEDEVKKLRSAGCRINYLFQTLRVSIT